MSIQANRICVRRLVVDDSELVCRLASKLLERRGLYVATLTDPLKFWDALEVVRGDPHWEFLPIVFLSAQTDAGTIQRLFMAGSDDFVSKPIVGAEFITQVQNRLGRARLYRHRMEPSIGMHQLALAATVL